MAEHINSLDKTYKGFYPFKLSTTSFIYRDTYAANVRMLGPYLDEIELLMFESRPEESLPTTLEIKELAMLASEYDITYNIHLPTDIHPGAATRNKRDEAVSTLLKMIELTQPLSPSTWTLHLPLDIEPEVDLGAWRDRNGETITRLLGRGVPARRISIETLDYPIERVGEIIDAHDLSVCLDIGHLFVHGFNADAVFSTLGHRTSIIHLHGVENTQDHISLDRLSRQHLNTALGILRTFTGVVSLEVFNLQDLRRSLRFLETAWSRPSHR